MGDKARKSGRSAGREAAGLLLAEWPAFRDMAMARRQASYLSRLPITRNLCRKAKHVVSDSDLWTLALCDELTGLLNRRGFLFLASQQLKLAARNGCGSILFFCDVDKLKQINDQFGHAAGDQALIRTARLLKKTFRRSDIVARFGGDEFVALALETKRYGEITIEQRLRRHLKSANAAEPRFHLSMSLGVARSLPGSLNSLRELISQADRGLYTAKNQTSVAAPLCGSAN